MNAHPLHFYLMTLALKKYIEGKSVTDFFPTYINNVKRTKYDLKKVSENVYQKIINKHFSKEELAWYLLYNNIFDEKFLDNPYDWKLSEVETVNKMLNSTSLQSDKETILKVSQQTNIKNVEKFFDINSDGESLWFKFLKQKYITPMFIIWLIDKINVNYNNESKEHKRVRTIISAMIKIERK